MQIIYTCTNNILIIFCVLHLLTALPKHTCVQPREHFNTNLERAWALNSRDVHFSHQQKKDERKPQEPEPALPKYLNKGLDIPAFFCAFNIFEVDEFYIKKDLKNWGMNKIQVLQICVFFYPQAMKFIGSNKELSSNFPPTIYTMYRTLV